MTVEELIFACRAQLEAGHKHITLVNPRGKALRGIRGELLCQNQNGTDVRLYRADRLLKLIEKEKTA